MGKIVVCLAFLAALLITASAQSFETTPAPNNVNLVGTINAKLKIRMRLTKQGNNLTGSYKYEAQKKDIPLQGTVNAQGYFVLEEYRTKNSPTGYFVGAFTRESVMVGFWSKDETNASPKLPLRLVEESKAAINFDNKFEAIRATVKNDRGNLQILLIDDTIISFAYENVGSNFHTCTMAIDRSVPGVHWNVDGGATIIKFSKDYFHLDENTAKVTISKNGLTYSVSFEGYLSYFCGARAMLPQKITLRKGANGWIGR